MIFEISHTQLVYSDFCIACGGTGKLIAKRKAMQFNGQPIDYDEVPCPFCNGTGFVRSSNTAPRSRRAD